MTNVERSGTFHFGDLAAALQHLEERGILRQTRLGFRRSW
jgi:hypothetical protein